MELAGVHVFRRGGQLRGVQIAAQFVGRHGGETLANLYQKARRGAEAPPQVDQQVVRQVALAIAGLKGGVAQQDFEEGRLAEFAKRPFQRRWRQGRVRRQVAAGDDDARDRRDDAEQVPVEFREIEIEDVAGRLVEVGLKVVEDQNEAAAVEPVDRKVQPVHDGQGRLAQGGVKVALARRQKSIAALLQELRNAQRRFGGARQRQRDKTAPSSLRASRVASVLLPAPPRPVSTTICASPERSFGSSFCSSRRRPMKCGA